VSKPLSLMTVHFTRFTSSLKLKS